MPEVCRSAPLARRHHVPAMRGSVDHGHSRTAALLLPQLPSLLQPHFGDGIPQFTPAAVEMVSRCRAAPRHGRRDTGKRAEERARRRLQDSLVRRAPDPLRVLHRTPEPTAASTRVIRGTDVRRGPGGRFHQLGLKYLDAYRAEEGWRARHRDNPNAFRDTVLALLDAEPLSLDELIARDSAAEAAGRRGGDANLTRV